MDGEECIVRVWLGIDDGRACVLELRANPVGALWKLVRRNRKTDPDGRLGRMQPMLLAPRDRDRERHDLVGEAVLGCHLGCEVRGGRASRGREDADDRQLAICALVLDDVHLARPEPERRARAELLVAFGEV